MHSHAWTVCIYWANDVGLIFRCVVLGDMFLRIRMNVTTQRLGWGSCLDLAFPYPKIGIYNCQLIAVTFFVIGWFMSRSRVCRLVCGEGMVVATCIGRLVVSSF